MPTRDDIVRSSGPTYSPATGIVVAAPPATSLPKVITGRIAANGSIVSGTGFTVAKTLTGKYPITFKTPFAAAPIVLGTAFATSASEIVTQLVAPTTTTVTLCVVSAGSFVDQAFDFIAYTVS